MRAFTKFCLLLSLLFGALIVTAQITTATIVGTVTDQSGAAVPNAQVTAVNTATNLSRSAHTNAQGEYRLEFLPVGTYRLEVTAAGFQKLVRNNVVLEIAQAARADAQLQVGQVSTTVEVRSEVPLVNTTNSEIGRTIDNKEIENLPIVNRNIYTLLSLTPGVQSNSSSGGASSIVLGYPEQRTFINGGVDVGAGSVNYYLDGGNNMTGIRNTGNIVPNPDAIQEFRVQTNNYNAEYGRFQNGVVNVITKSGTNQIHGSAFEFVRNTVFNANDWGNTLATPPLHRNQFGVTAGGPIIKDKTFFFASYGGLRQITNTFESSAVIPSAAELSGNFSNTSNGVIPVNPKAAGAPFPNNQVPIDPVAAKILQTYIPTAPNAPSNRFNATVPNPYNTDEFLGKIDHNLTDAQRLSFSYFETSGNNSIVPSGSNLPYGIQQFNWRQHNANVSDTWTISPTLINQVWATYTRNFGGRLNTPATSLASFGSAFTPDGPVSLPDISVTGFFRLADAIDGPVTGTNFYSLRDVVSLTHGRHSFSFGAEESLDKDIQLALLNNYGVFTFSGASTTPSGKKCPDCALADFELGIPSKVQQDAPSYGFTNSWYTAFFAQDDFRLRPRLTLNLGLRWDIQTPPTDPQDKYSTYVPGVQSTVRPTAPTGILFPGDQGVDRGIVPVRWNHLSPRIGFALDPFGDGKTSIRAAAGLFWGSVSGNEWNTSTNFEPFAIRINPFPNVNKTGSGATLANPYQGYPGGNPFPYNGTFVSGATIFGPALNFQWPYTYQFNASVQRQLANNLTLQVAYVGSLSHDEPFASDLNYPLPGNTVVPANKASASNFSQRRPNQNFGTIFALRSDQTASYNGLQISAIERLSHHFSFNAWYVYSHTFDSVQLDNNTAQGLVENFSNPQLDRGPADFDIRHQMQVALIWQPDYYTGGNRFISGVVNGWSIAPVFTARTGLPFSVGNSIDANFDGNTNDRAQLIGDPHIANPNVGQWFNTAAFAQNNPAAGAPIDGNSPRNGFRGPGAKNVDLAIFRTFKLTERFNLEFRAEGQNALNIANYNNPNATVNTSTFGQITSATSNGTGTMRQLQLGLRLTY